MSDTRRLAAVWFADIVGYAELFSRDEDLAVHVVRELQRITRVQCDARGGRSDLVGSLLQMSWGAARLTGNRRLAACVFSSVY